VWLRGFAALSGMGVFDFRVNSPQQTDFSSSDRQEGRLFGARPSGRSLKRIQTVDLALYPPFSRKKREMDGTLRRAERNRG
jgi:hypothetical protein